MLIPCWQHSSHLRSQHSGKWNNFNSLLNEEKMKYVSQEVVFVSTLNAHFGSVKSWCYTVCPPIIGNICKFYRDHKVDGDNEAEHRSKYRSFKLPDCTSGDTYTLTNLESCQFDIIVDNIAIKMSFREVAARYFEVSSTVHQLAHLTSIWEGRCKWMFKPQ